MILSDRDIKKYLESGDIVVDPLRDPEDQIQPGSIDLRLGHTFKWFLTHPGHGWIDVIDKNIEKYLKTQYVNESEGIILQPHSFVLATTIERVEIPDFLQGKVDGRSSLARLGILVHHTGGVIDAGFNGQITLEISNQCTWPVVLRPGMKICQMGYHMLSTPAERPYGCKERKTSKYQLQEGPTASRIGKDKENK